MAQRCDNLHSRVARSAQERVSRCKTIPMSPGLEIRTAHHGDAAFAVEVISGAACEMLDLETLAVPLPRRLQTIIPRACAGNMDGDEQR